MEACKPGDIFEAGRLGFYEVSEDDTGLQVLLGDPFVFTSKNIGDFSF